MLVGIDSKEFHTFAALDVAEDRRTVLDNTALYTGAMLLHIFSATGDQPRPCNDNN
jgi:hypothetical protein